MKIKHLEIAHIGQCGVTELKWSPLLRVLQNFPWQKIPQHLTGTV